MAGTRVRIHLSTLIILVLVAGVLLFQNLGVYHETRPGSEYRGRKAVPTGFTQERLKSFVIKVQGWPFIHYRFAPDAWDVRALGFNIMVAVSILSVVGIACEGYSRWRIPPGELKAPKEPVSNLDSN